MTTIPTTLLQRADSKCELCFADNSLSVYSPSGYENQRSVSPTDQSIVLCETCRNLIDNPAQDLTHWSCLSGSLWSIYPVVKVVAWRILNELKNHGWAADLLSQIDMEPQTLNWAKASLEEASDENSPITKDSNGKILQAGDTVTLIKDLDVKGAGFTAKRGTMVKNISLTANPEHIEGRVNGVQIVLLTCFLKKA